MKKILHQSALSLALAATLVGSTLWSADSHACAAEPYLGAVCIMATPNGFGNFGQTYIPAMGQLLPLNQYQALAAIVGTTWGGDMRTTIGVPDLRGRVVVGSGNSPTLGGFIPGNADGATSVVLSQLQLPQHNHALISAAVNISQMTATTTMTGVSATLSGLTLNGAAGATSNDPSGRSLGTTPALTKIYSDTAPSVAMKTGSISGGTISLTGNPTTTLGGTASVSGMTAAAGASTPVSLMQPYLVMNYYIAVTNGIFPSRD